MYAFSSKSGSEPFRALGDLTWNDLIQSQLSIQCKLKKEHKGSVFLLLTADGWSTSGQQPLCLLWHDSTHLTTG